MKYPVITITREFGSGGRTIARQLAEKLGYDYYDYNLVQKIAKESGLAESYIEEHGEDANSESSLSFAWNNWGRLNVRSVVCRTKKYDYGFSRKR